MSKGKTRRMGSKDVNTTFSKASMDEAYGKSEMEIIPLPSQNDLLPCKK
jgi:hypothetical protein